MKEVELVNGDLRFPALMAGSGEPVILLHGFPDCHENWSVQVNALADAGYTAIAPALRGYAPGCQPGNGDYSLYAAVEDLMVFANQLGGRVHLVGHDWGAAVGYLACAQSPDTFCTFSALSVPPLRRLPQALLKVPEQVLLSAYMQFFQLPVAPEAWLQRNELSGVEALWRRWSPDWEPGLYLENAKHTLAQPGVIGASLGWYRSLLKVWKKEHQQARQWLSRDIQTPTRILMGKQDGCMSPKLLRYALQESDFKQGVEVNEIEGAGHFLHLERPEAINKLLIEQLQGSLCDT